MKPADQEMLLALEREIEAHHHHHRRRALVEASLLCCPPRKTRRRQPVRLDTWRGPR
jgi:hypothetical protein